MPFTLENEIYFEEDIKKSRFQAIVAPVENEQAVKDFFFLFKDIYTTHKCWA